MAAMTALVALAAPRSTAARLVVFPAAWVVQELLRTYAFSGFPWALVSYPLAPWPLLTQTAALGGAALTSLLVVLVNAGLAEAVRGEGRARTTGVAVAAGVVAVSLVVGAARLSRPEAVRPRETGCAS